MADPVLWTPGIDVSLLPDLTSDCGTFKALTPTMLGQLVSKMVLTANHRLLYWHEDEPDVTTYPIYKQFIWVVPSTLVAKAYDDTLDTWEPWPSVPLNSLDGQAILDNSIPITKLLSTPADAGKVIYRNATGFVMSAPENIFTVGSIALQAIAWPTSPIGAFLKLTGSGYSFEILDKPNLLNRIGLKGLPTQYIKVTGGVDNKLLGTNNAGEVILVDPPAGSGLSVPIPIAADDGKTLIADALGGASWQALPPAGSTLVTNTGGPFVVPTTPGTGGVVNNGGRVEWTHGHASQPSHVDVWLQNTSGEFGYTAAQRVKLNYVKTDDGDDIYSFKVTTTQVIVFGSRHCDNADRKIIGYDANGAEEDFTPSSWRVYITATL